MGRFNIYLADLDKRQRDDVSVYRRSLFITAGMGEEDFIKRIVIVCVLCYNSIDEAKRRMGHTKVQKSSMFR